MRSQIDCFFHPAIQHNNEMKILASDCFFFAAIVTTVTADLVAEDGKYKKFLNVLATTPGLLDWVTYNFPVTIFGPTDEAFGGASDVVGGMNPSEMKTVFSNHAVAGIFTVEHFKAAGCAELMSLTGDQVRIAYHKGKLRINDATVVQPDLIEEEGVFHGINKVVLPGSFAPCSELKKGIKKATKKKQKAARGEM